MGPGGTETGMAPWPTPRGGCKADLVSLLCPTCLHLPETQKEIPIKSMLTEAVLQLP
jgi:hypothetical protein